MALPMSHSASSSLPQYSNNAQPEPASDQREPARNSSDTPELGAATCEEIPQEQFRNPQFKKWRSVVPKLPLSSQIYSGRTPNNIGTEAVVEVLAVVGAFRASHARNRPNRGSEMPKPFHPLAKAKQ